MSLDAHQCLADFEPCSLTELTTPFGSDGHSARQRMIRAWISGVCGAGLITVVQPAASAGASERASSVTGAFHGTMIAATPAASRFIIEKLPGMRLERAAEHGAREPRIVADLRDRTHRLAQRLAPQLAVLGNDEVRDLVLRRFQPVGEFEQHRRAQARRRGPAGRLEGVAGKRRGLVGERLGARL